MIVARKVHTKSAMTQIEAIKTARSRWGEYAYARVVPGINKRTSIKGSVCQIGYYTADVICPGDRVDCLLGSGPTWEAAFSDAMQRSA